MRFTKLLRRQIVEDFASRHGGMFDAAGFLAEVRKAGEKHPAYTWFEWDDRKAADDFRLDQARSFASDLRITFSVEEIGRNQTMRIIETSAPLVVSPIGGRSDGGGYFIFDPSNPKHQAELCREAGNTLEAWLKRYGAALGFVGLSGDHVSDIIKVLSGKDTAIQAAE